MKTRIATLFGAALSAGFIFSGFSAVDPWKITADKINPDNYYGISVGNGMIGVVSSPEPLKVKDVILNGVYDLYGRGMVSNFLKNFNLLNMSLSIDGDEITSKNITGFTQTLDMRYGAFTSSFDYGDKASVIYTYYALRQLPYSVLCDITISAKKDIVITPSSIMQAPDSLRDVENYYDEIESPNGNISLLVSSAKSPTTKLLMCAANSFIFSEKGDNQPRVIHEMWDSNMHFMKFNKTLKAGDTYSYAIVGSTISSAQDPDPLNQSQRLTIFAALKKKEKLIDAHKSAWDELWKSDIEIVGDPQAQQDVHSMLYHLYSFVREGSGYSLSPMGLSGLGYNGHVFWDADLWMFPVLLVLHPEIAESMVEYRYNRLDAARENAFAHGYKGAMFPWESAATGVEETPVWALSGPFEQHITADVALAGWNYYCVTQDKKWLREKGWPILSATADFWVSRASLYEKNRNYLTVVAADEWPKNEDNIDFTNAAAKANLRAAIKAAEILGFEADPDWKHCWCDIAGVIIESGFIAYNAVGFYNVKVPGEGTPSMNQAISALQYSRQGDAKKAKHFFNDAYIPNLNPPFRVIAETKGGTNPYFCTGAGGVLQAVMMGFAGIDITPEGIKQVDSVLPEGWTSLEIKGVGTEKKSFSRK